MHLCDLFAQFAVAVQVPGIVLSLERNEANGQMACCIALNEARPLAEKFVCVCVCKRRQELRWKTVGMSKVWADMTSAGVSFGPFLIASVSHSTSYWFN